MKKAEIKVWLVLALALALNLGLNEEAHACGDPVQEKGKELKPISAPRFPVHSGTGKMLKTAHPEKARLPVLIGPASILLTPWLSHFRILAPIDTTA